MPLTHCKLVKAAAAADVGVSPGLLERPGTSWQSPCECTLPRLLLDNKPGARAPVRATMGGQMSKANAHAQ
eukprot:scaffold111851_cov20-Tisochrysis_lutea.AAC.3